MPTKDPVAVAVGRANYYKRHDVGDPTKVIKANHEVTRVKLARYIQDAIAEMPPLSAAQINELALLLRGSGEPVG
jgi:hypothetical protein